MDWAEYQQRMRTKVAHSNTRTNAAQQTPTHAQAHRSIHANKHASTAQHTHTRTNAARAYAHVIECSKISPICA
jgi:superoxide dismutase